MRGSYATMGGTWMREHRKIVFQYVLMIACSLVAGWLLPRLLSEGLWQQAMTWIRAHFSPSADGKKELWAAAYSFFQPTLLCVLIIAVFSFSSLNCLVTDAVLVYLGMRTGCALSLLFSFRRAADSAAHPSLLLLFIFALCKLLLLCVFALYAVRMAKYAYRLRIYSADGRTLFHPRTVWALIWHAALCALAAFLLHFLYVCAIYFVSK